MNNKNLEGSNKNKNWSALFADVLQNSSETTRKKIAYEKSKTKIKMEQYFVFLRFLRYSFFSYSMSVHAIGECWMFLDVHHDNRSIR